MKYEKLNYAFVINGDNKQLSPTKYNKACYLVRKKKAIIINKNPLTIKLNKIVENSNIDNSKFILGIDKNNLNIGIAIIQECDTKIKPIFKGTIYTRKNISLSIIKRYIYHIYRIQQKRFRKVKSNKSNCLKIQKNLYKNQSILRVVKQLNKYIKIDEINLKDILIDYRVFHNEYEAYKWKYIKKNKLDENIRQAILIRDNYKCKDCGAIDVKLEVHHIKAKKFKGSNSLNNLITLCEKCHKQTQGKEEFYENRYLNLIINTNSSIFIFEKLSEEKIYLRKELIKIASLKIIDNSTVFNKQIDFNIKKSYSNKALIVTGFDLKKINVNLKDWCIIPQIRKRKSKYNKTYLMKNRNNIKYK